MKKEDASAIRESEPLLAAVFFLDLKILRSLCQATKGLDGVQIRLVNRQKQKRHCVAVPFLFLVTHPGIEPEFPA